MSELSVGNPAGILRNGWTGEVVIPRDLPPGEYTVELIVTDMAMNVHRASATVTVR